MQGTRRAASRCLGFVCIIGAVGACTTAASPPRDAADERALVAVAESPPLAANVERRSSTAREEVAAPSEAVASDEARSDVDLPWLSPSHIGAAVRAHHSDFQACQALGDLESQREDGSVTVGWAVRANGSVNRVTLGSTTFSSAGINSCVLGVAKQVTFPASAAPTQVSWTVKFRGAAHAPLADATLR
ncbi:MAG TPA: AgmX/PglI C-terminal domain-containing protein [Polyangiaceae bacterium]|nr:AgmX/PglI C-terminal domain-containing protein [Polyangiaceae bacterium]